ncbi:hypothetical protein LCGC14_0129130 [marine sediment metagenome]|uniref:Uncharacterized protein n=1 Tax=marine sediment metagenome TaxID=412755 RepID=A0A0F9XLD8_9ZZZZ|nr:hypothetical protein [Maribacter sp.]
MEENIFKRIESNKELPKEAKEELVSKIETAKLFQSFTQLFGKEYFSTLTDFFKKEK